MRIRKDVVACLVGPVHGRPLSSARCPFCGSYQTDYVTGSSTLEGPNLLRAYLCIMCGHTCWLVYGNAMPLTVVGVRKDGRP